MKTMFRCSMLLALATLGGCAARPPAAMPDGQVDFARFNGAIAVRAVRLAPGVADLPADELAALEQELHGALLAALPPASAVEDCRPGVLCLEITVTGLNASSPAANVISTVLLQVPLDRGGIRFEARFFDGDGEQPIALATHEHESSLLSYSGSYSRYGHAIRALGSWGTTLAEALGRS